MADICPACEHPAVGVCAERTDGVHPDLETYAAEMACVLTPEEYAGWAPSVGAPLLSTHGLDQSELSHRIDSPSGWSYMSDQENGDRVDCVGCGNPLNDDLPIVNDPVGYAYHESCAP